MTTRVVGIDPAQNHVGLVLIEDGEVVDYNFATDKAGHHKTYDRAARVNVEKALKRFRGDKHRLLAWRVSFVADFIWKQLMEWQPDFVAVEDYALRAEMGAHQAGEIGGVIRWMLYNGRIPFRLWDPTTLKMFVAHDGTCQKDEVERSVARRWGHNYSRHNAGQKNRQTSEDLADATGLAYMCWYEVLIRRGEMKVSDLENEKEVRCFNRITKYQKVPVIDREWILNDE